MFGAGSLRGAGSLMQIMFPVRCSSKQSITWEAVLPLGASLQGQAAAPKCKKSPRCYEAHSVLSCLNVVCFSYSLNNAHVRQKAGLRWWIIDAALHLSYRLGGGGPHARCAYLDSLPFSVSVYVQGECWTSRSQMLNAVVVENGAGWRLRNVRRRQTEGVLVYWFFG